MRYERTGVTAQAKIESLYAAGVSQESIIKQTGASPSWISTVVSRCHHQPADARVTSDDDKHLRMLSGTQFPACYLPAAYRVRA